MEKTFASAKLATDPDARALIEYLTQHENELEIEEGILYYEFPLFRDANDELQRAPVLLAARSHGIVVFGLVRRGFERAASVSVEDEKLAQLESILFGKCLQSKRLRKSQRELILPLNGVLVAIGPPERSDRDVQNTLISSLNSLPSEIARFRIGNSLPDEAWKEVRSIIEGTKAIIRPRRREVPVSERPNPDSKVSILAELESEIANFDAQQRRAAISVVNGPQRIRGLAGSGKT